MNTEETTKELMQLLKNLKEDEWNDKVGNWTIKDIICHLVGWEEEAAKSLKEEWRTKKKPWFLKDDNFDEFNKKSIKKYKNLKPAELVKVFKKFQKQLDELIEEIGEDNLRDNMEMYSWVFDEEDNHYLHHLNQIKKRR
ncbi:MAG: DinB family protein [archaeon]